MRQRVLAVALAATLLATGNALVAQAATSPASAWRLYHSPFFNHQMIIQAQDFHAEVDDEPVYTYEYLGDGPFDAEFGEDGPFEPNMPQPHDGADERGGEGAEEAQR